MADQHLRRGGRGDAAAVSELFHRSFTATFGHLYPPEDLAGFLRECSKDWFEQQLADPDIAVMLGEVGARLEGYCLLGPQDLPVQSEGRWWVLRQLYLEEEAKRTGIAARLMEWALAESRARGMDELYLTVWVDNRRARAFYARRGFEEVGRYDFRVGSTIDDDRILRLKL